MRISFLFILMGILILVACVPVASLTSIAISGAKMANSAQTRQTAKELDKQKNGAVVDSSNHVNYARYFIYRDGSFIGCALYMTMMNI